MIGKNEAKVGMTFWRIYKTSALKETVYAIGRDSVIVKGYELDSNDAQEVKFKDMFKTKKELTMHRATEQLRRCSSYGMFGDARKEACK